MLTKFINELEKRLSVKNVQANRPRNDRKMGTPVKKEIPRGGIPKWMLKPEFRDGHSKELDETAQEETANEEQALFEESDNSSTSSFD